MNVLRNILVNIVILHQFKRLYIINWQVVDKINKAGLFIKSTYWYNMSFWRHALQNLHEIKKTMLLPILTATSWLYMLHICNLVTQQTDMCNINWSSDFDPNFTSHGYAFLQIKQPIDVRSVTHCVYLLTIFLYAAQYLYFSVFQEHIPTPDNQQNLLAASEDWISSQSLIYDVRSVTPVILLHVLQCRWWNTWF